MTASSLTFGSLFAGIAGFEEAARRCGIETRFGVEIDDKCNQCRSRHFPDAEVHTDVATFSVRSTRHRPGIISAGWPCQGNSVAGRRGGMADERSGLWGEVRRVLAQFRPRWFLGENVPGILSVNGGRDWLTVLRDLAKLGYGTAYRVCDAQYFGVPQRRRRVFVVGYLGDWRRAAEVLFESESLPWNPPPSRSKGTGVARCIATGTNGSCYDGDTENFITHTLCAEGFDASEDGTGRGTPIVPIDMRQASRGGTMTNNRAEGSSGGAPGTGIGECGDPSPTLADSHTPAVAYTIQHAQIGRKDSAGPQGKGYTEDVAFTLDSRSSADVVAFHENQRGELTTGSTAGSLKVGGGKPGQGYPAIQNGMAVRRLTPRECERLQGFPDDWTAGFADGPRYRMLGNSIAVPCAEWIIRRLVQVNESVE